MAQGVRPMSREKFNEAFYKFMTGEVGLLEAAKIAGRAPETLKKYFDKVLMNEPLPDNMFYD